MTITAYPSRDLAAKCSATEVALDAVKLNSPPSFVEKSEQFLTQG